jgi:uncharacterized membrane protein YgaE (UPF0421/DUF939 family)
MWPIKYERLSAWDVAYAVDIAVASLLTYFTMTSVLPRLLDWTSSPVGVIWAVISTVFVFRDTRVHSLVAGQARLLATCVSFVLCLGYLLLFPFTAVGMAVLLVVGSLFMMLLGRRDEIGLTGITTIVVMVVAADQPHDAWHQPLLRLMDTVIGIAVGVACKWILSSLSRRVIGEQV